MGEGPSGLFWKGLFRGASLTQIQRRSGWGRSQEPSFSCHFLSFKHGFVSPYTKTWWRQNETKRSRRGARKKTSKNGKRISKQGLKSTGWRDGGDSRITSSESPPEFQRRPARRNLVTGDSENFGEEEKMIKTPVRTRRHVRCLRTQVSSWKQFLAKRSSEIFPLSSTTHFLIPFCFGSRLLLIWLPFAASVTLRIQSTKQITSSVASICGVFQFILIIRSRLPSITQPADGTDDNILGRKNLYKWIEKSGEHVHYKLYTKELRIFEIDWKKPEMSTSSQSSHPSRLPSVLRGAFLRPGCICSHLRILRTGILHSLRIHTDGIHIRHRTLEGNRIRSRRMAFLENRFLIGIQFSTYRILHNTEMKRFRKQRQSVTQSRSSWCPARHKKCYRSVKGKRGRFWENEGKSDHFMYETDTVCGQFDEWRSVENGERGGSGRDGGRRKKNTNDREKANRRRDTPRWTGD